MSVAEMKLVAINEIAKLNNENELKEILEHLAKLSGAIEEPFDVEAFLKKASEKYDVVLQKLAQ
jgi:cytochrome c556